MNAINYEPDYEVKSCSSISCEDYTTQNDCLGKCNARRSHRSCT